MRSRPPRPSLRQRGWGLPANHQRITGGHGKSFMLGHLRDAPALKPAPVGGPSVRRGCPSLDPRRELGVGGGGGGGGGQGIA